MENMALVVWRGGLEVTFRDDGANDFPGGFPRNLLCGV